MATMTMKLRHAPSYDPVFETALKQDIPRPIIGDLIRIFANDIDFQRSVSGGDSFEVFYDNGDDGENRNELLYASITTRNRNLPLLSFPDPRRQPPSTSTIKTAAQPENSRSARQSSEASLTSGFGVRFHPILCYSRPHTGVDWAALIGTPIRCGQWHDPPAGWDSGYGRRVEIQHANGYVTTYNHMSGFAQVA